MFLTQTIVFFFVTVQVYNLMGVEKVDSLLKQMLKKKIYNFF